MATIDVLDPAGKKSGTRELPAHLFEAPVSVPLMHQVVVAGLAGLRAGTHSTQRARCPGCGSLRQRGRSARGRRVRYPRGSVAAWRTAATHDHADARHKKMKRGACPALTDPFASADVVVDPSGSRAKTKSRRSSPS